MPCQACGAPLPGTARFCHKCGAAVAAPSHGSAGWQAGLPWAVAGAAVGPLLTVVALRLVGSWSGGGMRESGGVGDGPPPASRIPAPDISQMSPEEQARRLFDRVVGLAERGVQDSVRFFLPMALGAYAQLPALDLDARYDIERRRSEEHTSELQSQSNLVCRLLLEKKKKYTHHLLSAALTQL